MGLFGPKRPLGKDELEWLLAGFQYLLDEFGGAEAHQDTQLVNPLGDYFADSTLSGPARGEELFGEVKAIAGMQQWPTRLVARQPPKGSYQVNAQTFVQPVGTGAAGTYQLLPAGDGSWVAEIRYDVGLLADPPALVATFAHELGHYLLSTTRNSFPGGEDMHELLTDLTAVFMGLGVFLANSARDYSAQQLELGGHMWQSRRQGYLSERALVTALVANELLAGRDPRAARPFLKSYLAQDLDLALKWFDRRDIHADVAAIDLDDYGVAPWEAEASPP
jgi:hypothetical protein